MFGLPDVPVSLEAVRIIAPYTLVLALVGLIESFMTAKLVDDITDTHSDKPVSRGTGRRERRHGSSAAGAAAP